MGFRTLRWTYFADAGFTSYPHNHPRYDGPTFTAVALPVALALMDRLGLSLTTADQAGPHMPGCVASFARRTPLLSVGFA
ncbi:MAG: hypothetical protein ACREXW_14050 [Gammaproteobacteria bacterium]